MKGFYVKHIHRNTESEDNNRLIFTLSLHVEKNTQRQGSIKRTCTRTLRIYTRSQKRNHYQRWASTDFSEYEY
jgi:hypothetical protein